MCVCCGHRALSRALVDSGDARKAAWLAQVGPEFRWIRRKKLPLAFASCWVSAFVSAVAHLVKLVSGCFLPLRTLCTRLHTASFSILSSAWATSQPVKCHACDMWPPSPCSVLKPIDGGFWVWPRDPTLTTAPVLYTGHHSRNCHDIQV